MALRFFNLVFADVKQGEKGPKKGNGTPGFWDHESDRMGSCPMYIVKFREE